MVKNEKNGQRQKTTVYRGSTPICLKETTFLLGDEYFCDQSANYVSYK